jgi:hypothetical protein
MPTALELYRKSDVYKQQVAKRIQGKQKADEARTTGSTEKQRKVGAEILQEDVQPGEKEGKPQAGLIETVQDETVRLV